MSDVNTAENLNGSLQSLYQSYLPTLRDEIQQCISHCGWIADEVSKLFFMKVDKEYVVVNPKILFVGRETYGWGTYNKLDEAVDLMANYENVSLSKKHYNSPFWWFRESFSEKFGIGKDEFMKATLWTNLSKIDVNKRRPPGARFGDLSQYFIKLLVDEIEIIKPDLVIIMTTNGHYNWHINNYNWLDNKLYDRENPIRNLIREPVLAGKIVRLAAPRGLPYHTYQICHPNALRRKKEGGGYHVQAEELIEAIKKQIGMLTKGLQE